MSDQTLFLLSASKPRMNVSTTDGASANGGASAPSAATSPSPPYSHPARVVLDD